MKKIEISFILMITIAYSFFIYSTRMLRFSVAVNETFITHQDIPITFNGTRIIQFSDLLIETEKDLKLLKNTVERINSLNPDIVVFTGNLLQENSLTNSLSTQVESLLATIDASLGKVAVLGQADLLEKEGISQILTDAAFTVLRNDSLELFNGSIKGITFIGIDPLTTDPNLTSLLSRYSDPNTFNFLLLHEPAMAAVTTDYPIEVQLSGSCLGVHRPLSNSENPYCSQFHRGTYRFADQLILNVNSGLSRPDHLLSLLKRPSIDSFLLIKK